MDQEKGTETKKGSLTWLWAVIVIVILVAVGVWYFTKSDDTTTTETTDTAVTTTTKAPKHADWTLYTSAKYGFKLYYPATYTVAEGATGTIKLNKGTTEMVDLYVYNAEGDSGGMMKSQTALFTDDTKGYMTGGVEAATTVAGETATIITGTFGKNAGISQTHTGVKGSTVAFIKNDNQYVLDSYDNADATAITIFQDILADISF